MIKKNVLLVMAACNIIGSAHAMNKKGLLPSPEMLQTYSVINALGSFLDGYNTDRVLSNVGSQPAHYANAVVLYLSQNVKTLYANTERQLKEEGMTMPDSLVLQKQKVLESIWHRSSDMCEQVKKFEWLLKMQGTRQSKL